MRIKDITNRLDKEKRGELLRFGIVGVLATGVQYGVYLLALHWFHHNMSMTLGYMVSFVFNFIASTHYTFKVKASAGRGVGFAFSHAVNYLLQILTLNFFMWLGMSKQFAPIPMFCVCVPVNFMLVRFFLKK